MEENHLPVFGIGPYLISAIGIVTITSFILSYYHLIPVFKMDELNMVLIILGIILIVLGAICWLLAVFNSNFDKNVKENNLITTGIYVYIRHPIYASFLYIATGIISITQNIILFVLPVLFWAFLSISMKKTEEKWLADLYGNDYIEYSKKVNRFIPKVI